MLRLLLALLGIVVGTPAPTARAAEPLRDLAYGADAPDQSLDLYLPDAGPGKPPLVAFVSSRFWSREGEARLAEWGVARPLQRAGAAVAVIRHRVAPKHRHPVFAQDAAAALAMLVREADRHGYDATRIFLAGHSSGAQTAGLLALDPELLRRAEVDPARIAGVIAISGVHDLDPEEALPAELEELVAAAFGGRSARRAASPVRIARAEAPPFLVLAGGSDVPGLAGQAAALAEALRAAGAPAAEAFVASGRDHLTILDLADEMNPARAQVLGFVGLGADAEEMRELFAGRATWRNPPFSTEPFFALGAKLVTFEPDERFLRELNRPFAGRGGGPLRVRPARVHAIDLFDLLEALGPERTADGPWLVIENVRGERSTWNLEEMRPYLPIVVVGLDDERNLFRLTDVYHTRRMYSWAEPERQRIMARPLGGLLYFLKEPPRELFMRDFGRTALEPGSFRRVAEDPLAPVHDLPLGLLSFVTVEKGCLGCHRLRGAGANAAHIRLADARLTGGVALDLEQYPAEAWRRYCFEQQSVADEVGATPVDLPPETIRELYELVVRERERLGL
jgi:acetyl esterase/lipase